MSIAYQHKPLSQILIPAAASGTDASKTANAADTENKGKELPEKYKGKTEAEIAEMHMNAEKRIGQLSNELGTYRGLVSDLSKITRQTPDTKTDGEDDSVDVSGDDLIADPVKAIRKVVQHDLSKADATRREEDLSRAVQAETARLMQDFGDIAEVVQTEDFQKFADRTESRRHDFNTAANGKGIDQVRAARRLLEDYNDYRDLVKKQEKNEGNVDAARAAATEGGGNAGAVSGKKQYRESEVLALIQKDPATWRSPSYQAEIMKAIKEGRYIKNA
jgi:hypothetical protein